jgi:hypothetical protein
MRPTSNGAQQMDAQVIRKTFQLAKLREEIRAWQKDRNRKQKTITWQFTADDARIRLRTIYPVI